MADTFFMILSGKLRVMQYFRAQEFSLQNLLENVFCILMEYIQWEILNFMVEIFSSLTLNDKRFELKNYLFVQFKFD